MPKSPKKALIRKGRPSRKGTFLHHAYLREDGSVDGEKLLSIVNRTPGAFDLILLNALIEKGNVPPKYYDAASQIVSSLVFIIMLAGKGDEQSETQLKAIQKLAHAGKYDIPPNKIKEIVDRYETSPPLARAWEIRRLMSQLSYVVEPKNERPYSEGQPVKLRELPVHPFYTEEWNRANRHWKPNSTLQSLALHIYLEQLEKEGIAGESATFSHRSLKRDLERAREWETTASQDEQIRRGRFEGFSICEGPIIWYQFSEGWKVRKLAADANKNKALRAMGDKSRKELS